MYHALIIDDEADARGVVRKMLELFCPQVSQFSEAKDTGEALNIAATTRIDLAFIDIQLRRENGLDLAEQLIHYVPSLIFVTAYDHYAVRAFQSPAIHYLLKPVDPDLLQQAVDRASQQRQKVIEESPKILLNTKQEIITLPQNEILYLKGEGNYCTFYCDRARQYIVSKNLAHYQEQLLASDFFRIHQSFLVRLKAVREIISDNGFHALLQDGSLLPVARRRKDDFIALL